MWRDGSDNYSAGLDDYSQNPKSATHPQSSSIGMEKIALCCDLKEKPQVESPPTELFLFTDEIISSHLTIYPTYTVKWLANSTAPLSNLDRWIIHLTLRLIA